MLFVFMGRKKIIGSPHRGVNGGLNETKKKCNFNGNPVGDAFVDDRLECEDETVGTENPSCSSTQ
jgi:hypothetical protein